jgi:hypothetical protein
MPLSAYFLSSAPARRGPFAVLGEDVSLLHLLGAFAARERRLVEGDVADQIEGVVVAAHLLGQFLEEHALAASSSRMACFRVGIIPNALRKASERGVGLADGFARVVLERFGDQLAVLIQILHALGGNADLDVVDVVLGGGSGLVRRPEDRVMIGSGGLLPPSVRARQAAQEDRLGQARRSAPGRHRNLGSANRRWPV